MTRLPDEIIAGRGALPAIRCDKRTARWAACHKEYNEERPHGSLDVVHFF